MQEFIRKLAGFSHLHADDIEAIHALDAELITIDRGVDIISEGDKPKFLNLVHAGLACRYKLLEDGRRQITAYLIPGDLCDLNVYVLDKMDHGIMALTQTLIMRIDRTDMDALLERPRIALGLLKSTLVDEAVLRQWIISAGRRRAIEAIAHLFCEVHARMAAVGHVQDGSFFLPITQQDLGDTIGLTPVHVNRSLQEMRSNDLIRMDHGALHIPDIARLHDIAGFEPLYLHLLEKSAAPGRAADLVGRP